MTGPAPIKLGVLLDDATPPDERDSSHRLLQLMRGIQLRVEQANAAGGIEGREIALSVQCANGAHAGLPENMIPAWLELYAQPDVVGVIGPGITDNCLVIADLVAERRLPTICWPGTEFARNDWYFQFQAGSLSDEGPFLAALMARRGLRRVAVLQQGGPVGDEYYAHFGREARLMGLQVVAHEQVTVHQSDVASEIGRMREAGPDAVLFLGMGEPTLAFGRAFAQLGWSIPRFGNIAAYSVLKQSADVRKLNEGLIWADQYEPRNRVRVQVERDFEARFGIAPAPAFHAGAGYDMASLMVEGLRRSTNLSRAGLKAGLERVHQLPCATGGLNPVMGFSPWDRQAIKGPDLLMYRTVRNGESASVEA